jgi:hypothetical protein
MLRPRPSIPGLRGFPGRPAAMSSKCQSSGAALGAQAYKQCRALLEDKMSIENDVPPDRSYARTRGRN